MYQQFFKPLLDFLVALVAFIVFSPVILVLTVILFIANNGKPFFFQQRIGLNNQPFKVMKFKTMNDKRGAGGELLPDADRLHAAGSFVRKTSLDELPQLLNVLKGDMSLVGPRPLLPEYLPLYDEVQIRRHAVKPGITGWAQVNGRNAIGWQEKFAYDVWYVDNISFAQDVRIIMKTAMKVVKSEGVSADKHVTMEKFKGNQA